MIELLRDVPAEVVGVRAGGKLTVDDYTTVVEPLVDDLVRDGRPRRWLVEVEPDFRGLTPGALREDVRQGLRAMRAFGGVAVVTDIGWIRRVAGVAARVMPYPMRTFASTERPEAITWLCSLPGSESVNVRLLDDRGVVLVTGVAAPLRIEDIEALQRVVDGWLDGHPTLPGIVVHARALPGWANIGAFVRHVRFVRGHHRRIERLAAAADGLVPPLAAGVAGRLVHPQVRRFPFVKLEDAIDWAASAPGR